METQNSQRRYRYIFFLRIVLGLVIGLEVLSGCLVFYLIIGALINFSLFDLFVAFSTALLIAFFMYGTFPLWYSYIEFSSDGIVCDTGMYHIYSPWENIMTITRLNTIRYDTVFILREPARITRSFFDDVNSKQPIIERRSFLMRMRDVRERATIIPFLVFVSQSEWESGEIQAYFQQYAPHLLEKLL